MGTPSHYRPASLAVRAERMVPGSTIGGEADVAGTKDQLQVLPAEGSAGRVSSRDQPNRIRIVVLADICLYREGLKQALARSERVDVAGTAGDVCEALELVREVEPDIVLLDFRTSDTAALIRALLEVAPTTKVVPLAVHETDDDVIAWAEAGAVGYVSREASLEDLLVTIEAVARGETPCSPRIATMLFHRVAALARERRPEQPGARLTPRELEIARLIQRGHSNKEIAGQLHIEVATVKNHVHSIFRKLEIRRRGQAAARLLEPTMVVGTALLI